MTDIHKDCITWWKIAKPGQWFIGICDYDCDKIRIVPVNIFDSRDGKLKAATLENTDERGMNRYASGAPGERQGDSIMPPFLTNRQNGVTHHAAVMLHFKMQQDNCWGFSLVKYSENIAQLKTASNSMNSKPGNVAPKPYSFSHATRILQRDGTPDNKRPANAPGSQPMPWDKTNVLVKNLSAGPLRITNIAVHGATIVNNNIAKDAIGNTDYGD